MSPQQLLYKIWHPDQAPGPEPMITLHNQTALRFFVQAASTLHPFAGKPFAVIACEVHNELFERPVAEGTYRLYQEGGRVQVQALYESGIMEPDTGLNVISAALKRACAEQEHAL